MKRKLLALVIVGCMTTCLFVGCGNKNKMPSVDASKNVDLTSQVTDNNKTDAVTAYEDYTSAIKATEDAESASIATEVLVSITMDGTTVKNSQAWEIARSTVDDKKFVDFTMITKSVSDDSSENGDEEANKMEGYFADGNLYFKQKMSAEDTEDTLLKETMEYEDLMNLIGSTYVLSDISADMVDSAALEEKDGNKNYIFLLDQTAISDFMAQNLMNSGVALSSEESIAINHANISATVNGDGMLTAYTFSVDAVINDQNGETPFSYNIASAFSNMNSTDVKVRKSDELDKYIDVEEYSKMLQQQAEEEAQATTEEPSGKPLSDADIDALGIDSEQYDVEIVTTAE